MANWRRIQTAATPPEMMAQLLCTKLFQIPQRRSAQKCTHTPMQSIDDPDSELVLRAVSSEQALDELLEKHRARLKEMLRLRIHPKIQSRVDESDIIQDLMIDATRNFAEYACAPRLPFYIWLRHLAGLKLTEVHRFHLGTAKRDARQELSLEEIRPQDASAASMALQLVSENTNPGEAALKQEMVSKVQIALEQMDPIDREILALRHFEQLSVSEAALELGLSKAGAGSRYIRALRRLRTILGPQPET